MSGIAGLIRFDGGPIEPGLIETMTESMAHRGPDGIDTWSRGPVALGQCMLRTTPESLEETQPLANEDESVVLVMDGRVDNWEELRAELLAQGARLRTRADAELVLRAYERWGQDCVHHMDGDFALVIWDERRREAFCARDRMGHKPFHYHWDGKRLAIASELHAILALPWVDEEINEGMVAEHISDDLFSLDETLWRGVFRLPPAHRMLINENRKTLGIYWTPDLVSELRYKREKDYVEHHQEILESEVAKQSRAMHPLACEVSGGLDSSSLFAVAERLRHQGLLMAPDLEAYTFRIEGDPLASDLAYARAVGAHLGRTLHELLPARRSLEWYREWARRYKDLPPAPNGATHLAIYEAARVHGSRAVMGGLGGDQWLSGDHTYFADALSKGRLDRFIEYVTRDSRTYGIRRGLYLSARFGAVPLLPDWLRQKIWSALARVRGNEPRGADWMAPSLAHVLADRKSHRTQANLDLQRPVHRHRLGFLFNPHNVFAQEVMDQLAASRGLELRWPLDSAAVVQFGFSVPQEWQLRNGWDRYLHRRTVEKFLPSNVTWRETKGDFRFAFEQHRAGLSDLLLNAVAARSEAWVLHDRLAHFLGGEESEKVASLFRLWGLFACDAVRETASVRHRSGVGTRRF